MNRAGIHLFTNRLHLAIDSVYRMSTQWRKGQEKANESLDAEVETAGIWKRSEQADDMRAWSASIVDAADKRLRRLKSGTVTYAGADRQRWGDAW